MRLTPAASRSIVALHKVQDEAALPGEKKPAQTLRFYAPTKISSNISETKEGFLICHDVCIARTGEMLYRADEIEDVEAGPGGVVRITRDADELFRPEAIASFEGKPLCYDHPFEDVTAENWSGLARGHMQNVRRGDGDLSDFLLADILVMDKQAIIAIISGGKREVSLGYDADYEQVEPGIGRQRDIVGNHIALVTKGRCGPRCAIRDRRPPMPKLSLRDALLRAFKAKDAEELEELQKNVEPDMDGTHVHVHLNGEKGEGDKMKDGKDEAGEGAAPSMEERMAKLEAMIEKLMNGKKEATEDKRDAALVEGEGEEGKDNLVEEERKEDGMGDRKTHDAATVTQSYSDFLARAEILAPGVKMPRLTKDAAMDAKKTRDGLCICKRRALDAAMKNDRSKEAIAKFFNTRDGATVDNMSCDRVDAVFVGASELLKAANNGRANVRPTRDSGAIDPFARGAMDKIHQDFWAGK